MSSQLEVCLSVLVAVAAPAGMSVKINELRVPEVIRRGTAAVLDCDYTLEDDNGLVVKWYFNDQSRPVYQWIPGTKKPQGLGLLRNKLNLEYRASKDARTWHRALHIPEPTADMSGEYTCVVSTFENEDRQTKRMLVFGKLKFKKKFFLLKKLQLCNLQSYCLSAISVYSINII